MDGDAEKEVVAAAVEKAKSELGVEEPRPVLEESLAAAASAGGGDGGESNPTAEELAAIDRDPKAKEVYRSLVRRHNTASRARADQRKDAERALHAVQLLQRDPQGVIRALAQHMGLRIEGGDTPTVLERVTKRLAKSLGPDAAAAFAEPMVDVFKEVVQEEVAPLRQGHEAAQQVAQAQALNDGIAQFSAGVRESGGDWDESVEREMAALITQRGLRPGPGMTLPDFLDALHSNVMAARARANRASGGGRAPARRAGGGGSIRAGMDPRKAADIAVAEAQRELGVR